MSNFTKLHLTVADPGEGSGGARPPTLILNQTEAQGAEKIFFGDCHPSPPLPYLRVWMTAPSYLNVWIRHCLTHEIYRILPVES